MKNTTAIGNSAETLASEYLEGKGYKIVERNYKDKFCEIDIVCTHQEFIVFVEVKYRSRADYGGAVGAITPNKFRRIQKAAEYYLSQHEVCSSLQPRLDVITVVGDMNKPAITHIEDCELY